MKWDRIISAIVGAAIVLIFWKGCTPEPGTEYIDRVVHKTDTIWGDTSKVEPMVKWKTKHDTEYVVYPIPLITDEDTLRMREMYKMRYYENTYRNSKAVVTVQDSVIGYLTAQKVLYKNLAPERIVDSTTITKVSVMAPKLEIRGGIDLTKTNAYLGVDLGIKKHTIGVAYDPLNKQGLIRYRYTLFRR